MAWIRMFAAVLGVLVCGGAGAAQSVDAEGEGEAERGDGDASGGGTDGSSSWDVESSIETPMVQRIDVEEGTWINLDVSPDGERIVFDLLGDLYVMPIGGGEAEALTEGLAWDQQPRFSPDGREVAFCSDRTGAGGTGGDNIWVVDLESGDLRQITDERYRLVNGPNWHPSGSSIVAKKHFTSRRSLGAGEMWMYHASGVAGGAGGGVGLTDKPTLQKDVNEPVFSPDGRYLYFSEDVWPGRTFEYNKDSHKQIYVVNRLDLETGEQERYITGPGGACRPQPSPDGEAIAFVRRVDGKTGLHLFDVRSGAVRLLTDELERDNQETWALHGVYPGYAWTPDGGSIVYWAKGKIRRIDVGTGESEVVPFRVRGERAVALSVGERVDPAPADVDVKLIRWPRVSPDGDRVVFQALGKLWVKPMGGGESVRLTDDAERYEFHPSWSRDGRRVVYTSWDDAELGAVRVVDLETGARWAVTGEPGHYAHPVFSPDGERVVYEKGSGGWITSPVWSESPGVYVADAAAGAAEENGRGERIARRGGSPQFGADGERVFLIRRERTAELDNTTLISVAGDGSGDEREHVRSDWATEFLVSPGGDRVAFAERFKVYVAPLVEAGRVVKVGPGGTSVPVREVSSEAGEYLSWGGDGERLYWGLGPRLFEARVGGAFETGADEEIAASAVVRELGFSVPHDVPDHVVAIVGGRLVTMGGEEGFEVIEDGAVVIRGNRIVAVGPSGEVAVPEGAFVLDVEGRTVLPGFFEAHGHGAMATGDGVTPEQNWVNWARLSFGVTSVHDPSNATNSVFASSEMTKAGVNVGPRTFSTGTILYGATGAFKAVVNSYEDALFQLERMRAKGAWSVKSYNQPRRDQRQQIVEAARALGMQVVPEGGATFMHNMTMIVDGHTGIEHTLPVEDIYADVLQLWEGTGVGMTPTLSVAYGGLGGEYWWYERDDVWKNPRVSSFVPPNIVEPRSKRRQKAPAADYNHIDSAEMCKKLVDIGINVQPGGHGQLQGLNTHWEMWMMVQGGMTAHEALRAGTLSAAKHFGMDEDLGSLEAGKLADIVVLEPGADPLRDIRDSEDIEWVIANGRVFESRTMNQLSPSFVEREPFFWERAGFDGRIGTPPVGSGCMGCGAPGIAHWHEDLHGEVVGGHAHEHDH